MRDLELSEDMRLQRRTWAFERIAWALMACIVLAALLGVFGSGVLARGIADAPAGSLSVAYPRFLRVQSPDRVELRFEARAGMRRARIWLARSFVDEVSVQRVLPEPQSVELAPDRLIYVFALGAADGPATVTIDIEARRAGLLRGWAGLEDDPPASFSALVYP